MAETLDAVLNGREWEVGGVMVSFSETQKHTAREAHTEIEAQRHAPVQLDKGVLPFNRVWRSVRRTI